MFAVEWIRQCLQDGTFFFTSHADHERQNDALSIAEVREAVMQGIILEQYEDTGRGESCLVVGFTKAGKPIHIVCGERMEKAVIITVYIPSPPKFKNPYERGVS